MDAHVWDFPLLSFLWAILIGAIADKIKPANTWTNKQTLLYCLLGGPVVWIALLILVILLTVASFYSLWRNW